MLFDINHLLSTVDGQRVIPILKHLKKVAGFLGPVCMTFLKSNAFIHRHYRNEENDKLNNIITFVAGLSEKCRRNFPKHDIPATL